MNSELKYVICPNGFGKKDASIGVLIGRKLL
jgi:hypothetical protein